MMPQCTQCQQPSSTHIPYYLRWHLIKKCLFSPPSHLAPSPFNLRGVRWLLGLPGSPLEGQCETLTRVDTCPSVPGKNMVRRVR